MTIFKGDMKYARKDIVENGVGKNMIEKVAYIKKLGQIISRNRVSGAAKETQQDKNIMKISI